MIVDKIYNQILIDKALIEKEISKTKKMSEKEYQIGKLAYCVEILRKVKGFSDGI